MEENEKLWNGKFILLIIMTFCTGAAGQMTLPLVAKYALYLGADIATAGTVAGLMSLMSLFICPFAGVLTDMFSRKKILMICSVFYGLALVGHAFATSIPMLVVLRILTGIFFSVNSVTVVAFSTAFIPRNRTGEGLGYTALATILASAVGPAISLKIVAMSGYGTTFIIAGLCAWLCFAVICFLPYKEPVKDPSQKKKFSASNLFAFEFFGWMLLAALFSAGNGLVSSFIAIIADERSISGIALFFTMYSGIMVVLRPLTGKLMDKKGAYFILIPAVICAGLGMIFIGVGYSLPVMLMASVFKALGQGSGTPTLQADVIKKLDKSRTGVAASTILLGQNLGNALAPMIGGKVAAVTSYQNMFVGYGIIVIAAGMLILFIQSRKAKK